MTELQNIDRIVGRIDGKLDSVINELTQITRRAEAIEVRLRSVEGKQHWYAGAAAALGSLIGYFTSHKF